MSLQNEAVKETLAKEQNFPILKVSYPNFRTKSLHGQVGFEYRIELFPTVVSYPALTEPQRLAINHRLNVHLLKPAPTRLPPKLHHRRMPALLFRRNIIVAKLAWPRMFCTISIDAPLSKIREP
jgi:hypothetical protein